MKYDLKYFIAYAYEQDGVQKLGHTEVQSENKIIGIEEVLFIASNIEEHYGYEKGSVTILNFKPFEKYPGRRKKNV